jgi:hypothetical protein
MKFLQAKEIKNWHIRKSAMQVDKFAVDNKLQTCLQEEELLS